MTAKDKTFNVRVNDELNTAIESAINQLSLKSKGELLAKMIDNLPILFAMNEKGMNMDTVIERINVETVKTEIVTIKKGINDIEFEKWKERLFKYNESANLEDRVFITQNLFLDLIGGNVTKLSQLYRDNEEAIKVHNAKMGKELSDNRKMISRVKKEGCQNLAEWIKGKFA